MKNNDWIKYTQLLESGFILTTKSITDEKYISIVEEIINAIDKTGVLNFQCFKKVCTSF